MKRAVRCCITVGLAISFALSACSAFTNREFKKNGYRIFTPHGVFVYEQKTGERTLTIGYGYNEKELIEATGDQKVDRIEYKRDTYKRGEKGTEEMFERADRTWKEKIQELNVKHVHEKWKNMTPSERAGSRGFYK